MTRKVPSLPKPVSRHTCATCKAYMMHEQWCPERPEEPMIEINWARVLQHYRENNK